MIDTKNIVQNLGLDNLTAAEQIQFLDEIQKTIKESKAQRNETIKSNITVVIKALKKIEEDIKSRYDEVGKQISDRVASIKDGKDGRDGRNGRDGKDGLPGRDGVDGKDGLNGRDGKDGQDGISVTNASIDFDGSLVFYLSDGTEVNVGEIVPVDIAEKIKVINTMSTNAAVEIKDEGNVITSGVTSINFTGSGVTATASGDAVTVNVTGGGGGGGDVTGPASSTDNAIVRFDGTTGKLVQNSVVTIADTTGNIAGVGTLTTSGNVGVGTGFPGARLDVNSAAAFTARFSGPVNTYVEVTDGTGSFKAQLISNSPFLTSVGSYPLLLGTNNTERMRLDTSGNLGIGLTPAQKLDVLGSGQFRPAATQDAVLISGRAGGTSSYAATITPTTLTANRTITLPDATTTVVGTDATQTLTNKRVNPRAVAAGATSGNLTPNGDTTDVFNAFGLTGAITMLAPSGTPVDGQRLMLRFEDNGTGRGITWTTTSGAYRAVGITLPTTTTASKITYVGCIYNSTDVFWDAIATVTQA